ncbi:MAG: fasciclin domain-containing protein [Steroidobacteraceae bacterium]
MTNKLMSRTRIALATLVLATAGSAALADSLGAQGRDVLSVASKKGQFSTLTRAIEAAGLAESLRAQGPVTIFAPTDEAFAKLPPAELESLLQPENRDKLVRILTHHVVAGKALETEGMKRSRGAVTAGGDEVKFALVRGRLRVEDARVLADYSASNGSVVAVDRVLIPN